LVRRHNSPDVEYEQVLFEYLPFDLVFNPMGEGEISEEPEFATRPDHEASEGSFSQILAIPSIGVVDYVDS
jgi:hypothetical protein